MEFLVWRISPLTTAADAPQLTSGNDTITAAAGELDGDDLIIDFSTTDNDTLNATIAADNLDPTIRNIENINLSLDVFAGANATFDAANVLGGTITMSSSKLGFNGAAEVDNVGSNNVTAGSNVTTLTVAGVTTGTINTGSATTASVTTAAATDVANVKVNGNVALTVATATELALTATAASVVTLTPGALTDITVTGNATIAGDASDLTALDITGGAVKVTAATGGALNVVDYSSVSSIQVDTAATLAVSNANGQTVSLTKANADLTVAGTGAAGQSVTVNISADQATGTKIVVNGVKTSTINLTADVEEIAALTIAGNATLNVAGDVTIAALKRSAATDTLILKGTGNVEITADTADVASVNSSALVGNLTFAQVANADISIKAGSGNDEITLAVTTASAAIETGDGTNIIDARTLTTGTLAVTGGTGVDTVRLDASIDTGAIIAMTGGGGADVILAGDGAATTTDLDKASTWAVNGFTTLAIEDAASSSAQTQTVTINGSQLAGFTKVDILKATSSVVIDDTFALEIQVDEDVTDLSGLVIANTARTTVQVTGTSGKDTIKGTNDSDVIITAGGADVINISQGGADKIEIAEGESASTAMVTITGFNTSDATSQADILDLDATTVSSDTAATGAVDVKGAITGGTGSETVTVSIDANGIATLAGADKAAIDTLAEWIAVMKTSGVLTVNDTNADGQTTAAFEFNGNTYVVSQSDGGAVWSTTAPTFDIIELVGVTGVVALDTSAALNTIVLA